MHIHAGWGNGKSKFIKKAKKFLKIHLIFS